MPLQDLFKLFLEIQYCLAMLFLLFSLNVDIKYCLNRILQKC